MTYLLTLLFFTQLSERDTALQAARDKHAAILASEEQAAVENAVKSAKRYLAECNRMSTATPTIWEEKGPAFGTPLSRKKAAVANAMDVLKKAEQNLELWKQGLFRPDDVHLPAIWSRKLAIGQVGSLHPFEVVSVIDDETSLIRLRKSLPVEIPVVFETVPTILKATFVRSLKERETYSINDVFWVSGKRMIGKQSVFVVEALDVK